MKIKKSGSFNFMIFITFITKQRLMTKLNFIYVQKYFDSSTRLIIADSEPQRLLCRLHALQFQSAQHGQVNIGGERQNVASRLDLT